MNQDHMKEIMSKLWNKDITSLTQSEIQMLIGNMFFQLFLIDVDSIEYTIKTDEFGCRVEFNIKGDAFAEPYADNENGDEEITIEVDLEDGFEE